MKKILFVIIPMILVSCTKMLDTQPYSFGTVENFYKTAKDAELGLTGCYSILNTNQVQSVSGQTAAATFRKSMHILLNAGVDELIPNPNNGLRPDVGPFALHEVFSQNEIIQYNFFFWFAGINRTNYLLDKIDDVEMNEGRKNEIKGEAHFLRGFFYTYLAMMYGGVPIYRTPEHDPHAQRESLQKVYELIISDFKHAYEILPNRASAMGRANKWSAAGYLAKVYTYLASCKYNNVGSDLGFQLNSFDWVDWQDMYAEALTVTQDIVDNSGYELISNYDYLFRETTDAHKDRESLFYVLSSTNSVNGNYNQWNEFLIPAGNRNLVGGGTAILRPTGELWTLYSAVDNRRAHNLVFALRATEPVEIIDGVTYYIPREATAPTLGTYCVGKFRYMDPASKLIDNQLSLGATPILRYADVLLLHAEALYYTGDEPQARDFLLEVRKRAVSNDDVQTALLTVDYYRSDFVQELLDERSRELCFEAWRRIDLIRFGRIAQAIADLDPDYGAFNALASQMQANWASYKIWYPIPTAEIDLSKIEPNPGYTN